MNNVTTFLQKYRLHILFLAILSVGLYLRFYKITEWFAFGFDQVRDAQKVRDILQGILVLNGPRTGVGQFFLGPLWYYLLVPFYYFKNMDPAASHYLNFLVNIFNFVAIFYVFKKIFSKGWAFFAIMLLAASKYLIEITLTPWNVSPIPGVATLIFYGVHQVMVKNEYKWVPVIAFLTGLFFHLHFAFVFFIPIIFISFFFTKKRKMVFLLSLKSSPLFLVWLIPIIVFDLTTHSSNTHLFDTFVKNNLLPFHLQWFLHRLNEPFIQFEMVLYFGAVVKIIKFIVPAIFIVVTIFEKQKKQKIWNALVMLWFLIPLVAYTFYSGSTSEYYMLFSLPAVLYVLIYLQKKALSLNPKLVLPLLVLIWIIYVIQNTKTLWIKPAHGGLTDQKNEVRSKIKQGKKIPFTEGHIDSYLYLLWTKDDKRF